jgi:hypothetical protein
MLASLHEPCPHLPLPVLIILPFYHDFSGKSAPIPPASSSSCSLPSDTSRKSYQKLSPTPVDAQFLHPVSKRLFRHPFAPRTEPFASSEKAIKSYHPPLDSRSKPRRQLHRSHAFGLALPLGIGTVRRQWTSPDDSSWAPPPLLPRCNSSVNPPLPKTRPRPPKMRSFRRSRRMNQWKAPFF